MSRFQFVVVGLVCAFLLVIGFGALGLIRDIADLASSARQTRKALAELKADVAENVAKVEREVGQGAAAPNEKGRAAATPSKAP